jgi:subfamily B ATP-binding cassette protein HlyB/CyaB
MAEPFLLEQSSDAKRVPPTALGCLAIIGRLHGVNLTVEQLIHDNLLTQDEVSTGQLLDCARRAGFRCKTLFLKWPGILDLKKALPSIVRLTDGRSRVLLRLDMVGGAPHVVLQDPNAGPDEIEIMDRAAFQAIWNGEIILIKRNYAIEDEAKPFSFGLILAMMLREKRIARDLVISAIMLSFLALTPILFWQTLSSRVIPYHAENTFLVLCCIMGLLIVFEAVFGAVRRYLLSRLTARVDVKLSTYMFDRLLNLPVDYFETTPLGITTYKIGQMSRVRAFLTGQVFGTVLDSGILIIFFPIMLYISPLLAGIVVVFCAFIFGWIVFMLPRFRERSSAVEASEAKRGAFLTQNIAGIRTVKSLALDARQQHQWDVLTAQTAKLRLAENDVANVIQIVTTPLERIMVSGTFAVGVYMAMTSTDLTLVGTLFAFNLLVQRVASPLLQMAQLVQQYDEARIAVASVASLVNLPPEEGRSGHGVRARLRGHVEFQNVRFTYPGAVQPALNSVSFEVPTGTTLGVMGRSGSGKTTLTRLLQKLHSDYQGLIKVDGVDVREYDVDHLRSSLGVVLQENFLFSGTIRDNITAAKSDATEEEVVYAARLAGAEEFIDKLPRGYDTYIYEGSPNLSGGQRQRLAIARALITNPRILILDEATSALDAESEAIVNANLRRIAQGRTMIVISHRLSSLVAADAILVLDEGEVHDIGKHRELLERCDIYSGLWHRQHAHLANATADEKLLTRGAHVA